MSVKETPFILTIERGNVEDLSDRNHKPGAELRKY
jgi:hypothetical protein